MKNIAGFVLHALAAGFPFALILFAQTDQFWIALAYAFLVGLALKSIWNAWGRTCLGVGLILVMGMLIGGFQTRVIFMQTHFDWKPVPSPGRTAVEFTYANGAIYCVRMESGDVLCCEPFPDPGIGACGPDVLTLEQKIETDDFGRLIGNKNRFFLPPTPGEVLDIYHYYYDFFEGDAQTSYILTTDGKVWRWNDFHNVYAMIFVIIAGIWGGAAAGGYYGIRTMLYNQWYRKQFDAPAGPRLPDQSDIHSPAYVQALFDKMSETYSLVNTVSSFGFAMRWRRQCVARISIPAYGVSLDVWDPGPKLPGRALQLPRVYG